MKSLPLSELRRRPSTVKKLTARGHSVQITGHGKPLWIMQRAAPANGPDYFAVRIPDGESHAAAASLCRYERDQPFESRVTSR